MCLKSLQRTLFHFINYPNVRSNREKSLYLFSSFREKVFRKKLSHLTGRLLSTRPSGAAILWRARGLDGAKRSIRVPEFYTSILLVDGDIIAYKAAASAETPVNWGDGLWTLHSYEQDVALHLGEALSKLVIEAPVQDCIVALSDKENYRKQLVPYYKANRAKTRKPMLLNYARDVIRNTYNTIIYRRLEADDVLGILGTANTDTIIWSEDKDLRTVPAKHWIDGAVVEISEAEADYNPSYSYYKQSEYNEVFW